jgi:diphthine-ammonia ligase
LIRKEIIGSAINQNIDYDNDYNNNNNSNDKMDEVEDLYELLKQCKSQYPDIEGVSCGAIVSTYQRLRVENVCSRLGLTVLSFLWQRDRAELLDEIGIIIII